MYAQQNYGFQKLEKKQITILLYKKILPYLRLVQREKEDELGGGRVWGGLGVP